MTASLLLAQLEDLLDTAEAVPALRQFILDAGLRGMLSQRQANEEPASAVLARCDQAAERAADDAGRGRQRSELQPVSETERPFELPEGWEWTRLGRIADFSAGRTPSRKEPAFWNTGSYPWVSIADMVHGAVITTTKETISERAQSEVFKSEPVRAGTMLMSFKLTIGKIARLGIPAFHNEAIIHLRPFLPELDPFLFLALPERARAGDTRAAIKGETLNRTSLANLLLPIPPIGEQGRIVARVDELMGVCDELESAVARREASQAKLLGALLHSTIDAGRA